MAKNTVKAVNQLKESGCVRFENLQNTGTRVMFVGNSITLHGVKEDIGWTNEWGMAASKKENDYVHILQREISSVDPEAAFCICQAYEWENDYKNGESKFNIYAEARKFSPNIIVIRIIENCKADGFDPEIFAQEFDKFINYLNESNKAKIVLTTAFWNHPGNSTLIAYANEKGLPIVHLSDLGERDDMKALGLFWHSGVANHPGDLGMQTIADRIKEKILPLIS